MSESGFTVTGPERKLRALNLALGRLLVPLQDALVLDELADAVAAECVRLRDEEASDE